MTAAEKYTAALEAEVASLTEKLADANHRLDAYMLHEDTRIVALKAEVARLTDELRRERENAATIESCGWRAHECDRLT
jgi:HAMP domain-containing protein